MKDIKQINKQIDKMKIMHFKFNFLKSKKK